MEFEDAANYMALNYARWEDKLYGTYKSKLALFEMGLGYMGISILLEIIILVVSQNPDLLTRLTAF